MATTEKGENLHNSRRYEWYCSRTSFRYQEQIFVMHFSFIPYPILLFRHANFDFLLSAFLHWTLLDWKTLPYPLLSQTKIYRTYHQYNGYPIDTFRFNGSYCCCFVRVWIRKHFHYRKFIYSWNFLKQLKFSKGCGICPKHWDISPTSIHLEW